MGREQRGSILVDRELRAFAEPGSRSGIRAAEGSAPIELGELGELGESDDAGQIQPASVDLRLGAIAWRVRAGFLPEGASVEDRLAQLATSSLSLRGDGAVLERGLIYLVPLAEELQLPPGVHARFNPRSSTGRCDVFTRVLVPGHPRFDEAPAGWSGRLWLEVAPLSFPVRLREGDRLCQLRLQRGDAALTTEELRAVYAKTPLCFDRENPERPLPIERVRFDADGALELRLGLEGRDPCGWRAALHTDVLDFAGRGVHAAQDFWEPVHARGGHSILDPGRFYLFASRERIRVPPDLAAEMLPIDVGIGELRNNYAGFFDNGFGWEETDGAPRPAGTPAVLEVRAHDVPFLVEDGQVFCRLRFFRTSGRPDRLYGQGRRGPSYQGQDLTLARPFRPPGE